MAFNVLLAVDGSSPSELAVGEVARRPWPAGTQIRVLSVTADDPAQAPRDIPVPSVPLAEVPPWPVGTLRTRAMWEARSRRIAEAAAAPLTAAGVPVEIRVREGVPGPAIVEEAEAWPADLIVLGSKPHSTLERILLGSVASYVLKHAACSVEVVRRREATG